MKKEIPQVVERVCSDQCSYFKPGAKEDLACRGYAVLQGFIARHPEAMEQMARTKHEPFEDVHHYLLHHLLCRYCDFFIADCDFTDPQNHAQVLPCGGYVVLDKLLQHAPDFAQQLLRATAPPDIRLAPAPHCVPKLLEKPYLYDLRADELYELDQAGFDFLAHCDGTRTLEELSLDKEFLETCLEEQLLVLDRSCEQRRFTLRPSPIPSLRYLELQLTDRCNLRCKHCYLGETKKTDLPLSEALSALEEFEKIQGLRVLFSGGEPLLYPEISVLAKQLSRFAVRKVLLTNGTLLRQENLSAWSCFDEIQFSLDGLKEGHETLRGPGTFRQTLQGIKAAQAQRIPVSIATMVHRGNVSELEKMERWIAREGFVEWNIDVPCRTGRLCEHDDLVVPPHEAAPFLKLATGGSYHGADEPFACGYHLCTVTPGGAVLKCGFFPGTPLGSLKEGLEVSWKRSGHIPLTDLECAPCPHLPACKGGCRFRADSPKGKDPVMCALFCLPSDSGEQIP
jgi:radical SAM protein with 4Fe4S-binding SPASM domain